jgi:hypothetical protein
MNASLAKAVLALLLAALAPYSSAQKADVVKARGWLFLKS